MISFGERKKRETAFVSSLLFLEMTVMKLKLAGSTREIDLVVFDCDGVLLDTMRQKIAAFRSWVPAAHADKTEAFMQRVMHGFGKSRRHHLERFYTELVGQAPAEDFLEAEVARFTEICEPLCAQAGWRVGSREFVQTCAESGVARYVLSGTPQAPLEAMLAAHDASGLFDAILGSPPAKSESMERILSETHTPAHRTVFIGDANADRLAAEHVGAHFVYFPSEAARPGGELATEVGDLRELLVDGKGEFTPGA